MLVIFLGFKSFDRDAVPDMLYLGHDASKGAAAAAATGDKYVRLGRIGITAVIPVALPESDEHRKLREAAEAAHAKALKERAEAEAAKNKAKVEPTVANELHAAREKLEVDLAEAQEALANAEKPAAKTKAGKAVEKAQSALDAFNQANPK